MNVIHNPINRQIDIQNAKVLRRPLQFRCIRRSKSRLAIVDIHINHILSCKVMALPLGIAISPGDHRTAVDVNEDGQVAAIFWCPYLCSQKHDPQDQEKAYIQI